MSDLLADFTARFVVDGVNAGQPVNGRIVMNREQLVLASDESRVSVPLGEVFDVTVGHVPSDVTKFFDDSVTVAWRTGDGQRVAVVEAGRDAVDQFATVLFKAELNGTKAAVVHPTRLGGRVLDTPATPARVALRPGGVVFRGKREFDVDLSRVTKFEREKRTIAGRKRPALVISHDEDGTDAESVVHVPSDRRFNILGRYLRQKYREAVAEVEDVSISEEGVQILVGLHAAGGLADPGSLLSDPGKADAVLKRLREKGLVADGAGATTLTDTGRIVVNRRLEEVNN